MNFLTPHFLWGFLALIPLIAAYLLKVRPRKKQTNAWFLWEKIFEEKNTTSLFSKMRNFLSLLLMLIALSLIILALAQPKLSTDDQRDLIIVIDRSASMSAALSEHQATSRLEKAKAKAHELVRSLSTSQRASLAVLDKKLKFITHLTNNAHRIHQSIDSITPSTIPLYTDAALSISSEKDTKHSLKHRVILITDGSSAIENLTTQSTNIEVLNISDQTTTPDNLGIIAADIQPNPADTSAKCMVKIISSLTKPIKAEIELFHTATSSVGKLSELTIQPGVNPPVFFDIPDAASGEWVARILREDHLDTDNSAQLILRPLPTIPVTIPADDNYFYQRCIEAFAKSGGLLQIAPPSQPSSITLYQGTPPADATGNIIIFAPKGSSPFWNTLESAIIVDLPIAQNPQHPILKHSDINQLRFPGAQIITPPENARIIVESDQKIPLIYQINEPNKSVIVVNLNPAQADFFLSPSFPILIHDAATYLSGHDTQYASVYPTGSNLLISDDESNTPPKKLNLDNSGIYDFTKKGRDFQIAAALLSPEESLLSNKLTSSELKNLATGYPFSFWLIVIAIAILILESILYHRRKAE